VKEYLTQERYSDTYNWLYKSKSPYLQQHKTNPVNWLEWSPEAFEKAKRENKPVFLSIGYSTCHWCHVMERESFEDEEVAKLLNERFVSIKVDREERPDVDSVYMRVCQMLTGQGGWPLNVFLTPDQKPFYAGTYFPKTSRYGRPGFIDAITQLYDKFINDPERIATAASQITAALNETTSINKEDRLTKETLHSTYKELANSFDSIYGGFGSAPKFPIPHMLMYLLRYHLWSGNEQALLFVRKTLDGMANGGIYDHIGFGFARYSTDQMWLVPHFEKMLYDNALLLHAYTEGYQVLGEERYRQISDEIVTFVKRELRDKHGAFYSAIDADSEGVEGKFYVWDKEEVLQTLGEELGQLYCEVYDITTAGNFEGKNIPNLIYANIDHTAQKYGLTAEQMRQKLEAAREILFEKRSYRVYPHLDDKILASWNALMISALAKAAKVYDNNEYLELAKDALTFIEENLIVNNRIMARYREEEVKFKGYIDDYAFLVWAYLEMYEATFQLEFLRKAHQTAWSMKELFWDNKNGGFYFYGNDGEELIVREKEAYDGAMPSGNGVAAVQLVRLAELTGETAYTDMVLEMLAAFKKEASYGSGHTFFLQSLLLLEMAKKEIVILGDNNDEQKQKLVKMIKQTFAPHYFVLNAEEAKEFSGVADFAAAYNKLNNETTVYICQNYACEQPITDIEQVLMKL
jgi:uncharacterized protein YyaL (SSP411 family)